MFLVNAISTGLILVELFYVQNPNYHPDYYDELRNIVKDIERTNPHITARSFCLEIMAHYLTSSNNRYKFMRKFVDFCKSLAI